MKTNKKLLSQRNPLFFKLAVRKGIIKRDIQDILSKDKFAHDRSNEKLPNIVSSYNSYLIKRVLN